MNNQQISGLTIGETYVVMFQQNDAASTTVSITGADLISEIFVSNGARWNNLTVLEKLFFIKATDTNITITGGNLYGVLIVQLY